MSTPGNNVLIEFDVTDFKSVADKIRSTLYECRKRFQEPRKLKVAVVDVEILQQGLEKWCGHDFYVPPGYDDTLPPTLGFINEGSRFYGLDIEKDTALSSGQAILISEALT